MNNKMEILICEALNWKNQEIATIDPLIVISPDSTCANNPKFYLLNKFNCTPSENHVSEKFTI